MKTFLFVSSFLITSLAMAAPSINIPKLKAIVIQKFIKEANNPKSELAKRINQINTENTDGRNPDGSITFPVKQEHLQVVLLSTEDMTNPWHYGHKSEDGKTCTADGDSASFLLLLSSYMKVHMAQEFAAFPFTLSVSEKLSAKRLDGNKIEYCQDVYDNEKEYALAPVEYALTEIKEIEIK